MDRGHKKWTAMYIPEHLEAIRETILAEERVTPPSLDQQQKEELNYKLKPCFTSGCYATVHYFCKDQRCFKSGILTAFDPDKTQIIVCDRQLGHTLIPLKYIYGIDTLRDDL